MLVGQSATVAKKLEERELLKPLIVLNIKEKKVEEANKLFGDVKLITIPEGVILMLEHVSSDKDVYPQGVYVFTIQGAVQTAPESVKVFARNLNGWGVAISQDRAQLHLV
jgi:hypothetical protein